MRPIVLATDYGLSGSYVGQLKSAIYNLESHVQVIDLIHDLPAFNAKASAYLLASHLEYVPKDSIVVGVVDPGVCSDREPIVLQGDGYTFIGPNNGLFAIAAKKLSKFTASKILLTEKPKSKTFHGRDIFAPIAAQIILDIKPRLEVISTEILIGVDWPDNLYEIIYIDHFGNAITGIQSASVNKDQVLKINTFELKYAKAFHCVARSEYFWYDNSNGLVEIAARENSACELLKLKLGLSVSFAN